MADLALRGLLATLRLETVRRAASATTTRSPTLGLTGRRVLAIVCRNNWSFFRYAQETRDAFTSKGIERHPGPSRHSRSFSCGGQLAAEAAVRAQDPAGRGEILAGPHVPSARGFRKHEVLTYLAELRGDPRSSSDVRMEMAHRRGWRRVGRAVAHFSPTRGGVNRPFVGGVAPGFGHSA